MDKTSKRGSVIFALALVAMFLASSIYFASFGHRLNSGQTATVECTVVDKYHDDRSIQGFAYAYHLELLLDTKTGKKETIAVSGQSFDNVAVGDALPCNVIYDDKGVIDIRVSDTAIDQYAESERHKDYFLAICIILCGYVVIGAALMVRDLFERRKAKAASELLESA